MSEKGYRMVDQEGSCPICGTKMTLRTSAEAITIHHCPGCSHSLALTDSLLIVVSREAAEKLLRENEAEPCGMIIGRDFSARYVHNKPVDEDYTGILSDFLDTEDVCPEDLIEFLNNIDDSPFPPSNRKS